MKYMVRRENIFLEIQRVSRQKRVSNQILLKTFVRPLFFDKCNAFY